MMPGQFVPDRSERSHAAPSLDREACMERFAAWLDEILEALDDEEAYRGKSAIDLHALWSATTALTQEIKLQGRSFKQLADVLEPLPALAPRVEEVLGAHDEALEATRDLAHEVHALAGARNEGQKQNDEAQADGKLVDVLLDVRDRLARGLHSARGSRARQGDDSIKKSWAERLARRFVETREESTLAAMTSLEEGYVMGLARLDAALEELQVNEIPSMGKPFDPRCMNALEVEESDAVPHGTVLEVFRAGYAWQGHVHRVAQVKVARPGAAKG